MNGFVAFWNSFKSAEYSFRDVFLYFRSIVDEIAANPNISSIWDGFLSAIAPLYKTIMTLAVLSCILIAFFGKKIKGLLTFLFFSNLGFAVGTHFLGPLIPEAVAIPDWVVGIVVALLTAVLHRFLYYAMYALAAGYTVYILSYNVFYLVNGITFSVARAIVCLSISLIFIVVAFIFRKYIEMVGTAALGGWLAAIVFARTLYPYNMLPIFVNMQWLAYLIPTIVIGIPGAIVQIKTRRRY